MALGIVALAFRCALASGTATAGSESKEVQWIPQSLLDDLVDNRLRIRIVDALANHAEPVIRTYSPPGSRAPTA